MTDAASDTPETNETNETPETNDEIDYPPPQTSDREYGEEKPPVSNRLPMSPRERELMNSFKRVIAQHLQDVGEKTTGEFLEGVALELWRLTRKQ